MAQRQAGLTSQQSNNASRRRKSGRANTAPAQSNLSLRPSASTNNYYVQPQRTPEDTRSKQLASALGQLAPTLNALGQQYDAKRQKEAEQQAKSEIMSMTDEEAGELVSSGAISEYENPYFQKAFQRQYGLRLGLSKGNQLASEFENNFDPRSGEIDDFLAQNIGPDIERLQSNPDVQKGFEDALHNSVQSLRAKDSRQKSALIEQDKMDGVYETFDAQIAQRLEGAATPEEREARIQQGVDAMFSQYGANKNQLNVTNTEQDTIAMQVAAKYARNGDRDVVEKILAHKRGGVGSILDKRGKAGAEASRIMGIAERNAASDAKERWESKRFDFYDDAYTGDLDENEIRKFREENPDGISEAQTRSLIARNRAAIERKRKDAAKASEESLKFRMAQASQGEATDTIIESMANGVLPTMGAMTVLDEDGDTKVWDADKMSEIAVEKYFGAGGLSERTAKRRGENEAQRFSRELNLASVNALEVPSWQNSLQKGAASANISMASGQTGVPPTLQQGYELYRQMKTAAPKYLDTVMKVDGKTTAFYESMRVAQEYGGMDTEQAAQSAFRMTQNGDAENNPSLAIQYSEIDQAVNNVELQGGFFNDTEGGDVSNSMVINTELRKAARFYSVNGGLSTKDALAEAKKRVSESFDVINGRAVRTSGTGVADALPKVTDFKIKKYAKANATELEERGLEEGDISVMPVSMGNSTAWRLVESSTGLPLDDPHGSTFTFKDVQVEMAADKEAKDKEAAAEVAEKQQRNNGTVEPEFSFQPASRDNPSASTQVDMETNTVLEPEGYTQANMPQPDSVATQERTELPDPRNAGESEQMVSAIEKLRSAGVTQADLTEFLQRARGEKVRWAGTRNDGKPMDTTFALNPTVREKLRMYLPRA